MLSYKIYTPFFYLLFCAYVNADLFQNLFKDFRLLDSDAVQTINKKFRRDVESEAWQGRWLPSRPGEPTPPPKILPALQRNKENNSGVDSFNVPMGSEDHCDNGRMNLTVDWDNSPENYTCYNKKITPEYNIHTIQYCEQIPKAYVAIHKCMSEVINYDEDLPLYGTHRPVWPIYGEYKFLPKQRWLHSLEHGAVVMLYHPCANPQEVKTLKKIVTSCLRRHVISPYNLLDEKRPLALLTWGCRLTMSYVQPKIVEKFIKQKALRGYEQISLDGDYNFGLLSKAKIVSDLDDTNLCPNS